MPLVPSKLPTAIRGRVIFILGTWCNCYDVYLYVNSSAEDRGHEVLYIYTA